MTGSINEHLPPPTLWRLLAVLLLCLSPHVVRLPVWESALIGALIAWRGWVAYKQWRLPPIWAKLALTGLATAAIIGEYSGVSGQNAGTALLCVMGALKLLELRERRDVIVLVFLMYFVLVTHFLFSQELWTAAWLLACALLITAALIECMHRGALAPRITLRKSATIVAQALPLMVLLFVLFPRIPGPLWGLPADAGAARSGLSDSMAPGDISSLIESDEIAFRVEFEDAAPRPSERYWRGPVLNQFDGRTWKAVPELAQPGSAPPVRLLGEPVRYQITIEPQRHRWLLALDMPDPALLPADAFIGADAQLLAKTPVTERRRYPLISHPDYRLQLQGLSDRERARNLGLPPTSDPRSRALAERWRRESGSAREIVERALRMFREQEFFYTLQPPPLGEDGIDEFLFETRRGFCEHYASSFTVLMRAAGVPARVVTGYQGAQQNDIGGYYVVRQSDAHAWSEVWIEGRGWTRVDPTAAIAPARIERGIEGALSGTEGLPGHLAGRTALRYYLEARWDWINAKWNGLVLAYGPELQQAFLSRFGLDDLRSMILALTFIGTGMLVLMGLLTLRQFLPAPVDDPALRQWQRFVRKLARAGLPQRLDEGPRDYAERAARARPQQRHDIDRIAELYLRSRYLEAGHGSDDLARLVRRFKP